MSNHYETLGVRYGAHPVEIETAFKTITESCKDSLNFETQLNLSIAYQTLIHPERRQEYNSELVQELKAQEKQVAVTQQKDNGAANAYYYPNNTVHNHYHHEQRPAQSGATNFLNFFVVGYIVVFAVGSLIGFVGIMIH